MKIITLALMCLVVAELAHSQEPKQSEAASLQGTMKSFHSYIPGLEEIDWEISPKPAYHYELR